MNENLMTTTETCELLQVSPSTLRRYRKAGMPHLRLGGRTVRFVRDDVEEWVRTNNE